MDRIPVVRGVVKSLAKGCINTYELGSGPKCTRRIIALFNGELYIYPGKWSADSEVSIRSQLISNLLTCHHLDLAARSWNDVQESGTHFSPQASHEEIFGRSENNIQVQYP